MMKAYESGKIHSSQPANILKRVRHTVESAFPRAQIILYGSQARGDAESVSDWDFLILVDPPVSQALVRKFRDSLYELELETDTVLSCIVRSTKQWYSEQYATLPFKQVVEREGIVL